MDTSKSLINYYVKKQKNKDKKIINAIKKRYNNKIDKLETTILKLKKKIKNMKKGGKNE